MMSIEGYEFSEAGVEVEINTNGNLDIISDDYCYESGRGCYGLAELNRDDVIALAKHFKLTPNDIEE